MKIKLIILTIIFAFTTNLFAQKYKDFSFMQESDFKPNEFQKQEDECVLAQIYSVEYKIEENLEQQFTYTHTVRWVNSDDAIESNNKIYVAERNNTEYLYQKSRIILPSGEIKELEDKDIKEGFYGEGDKKSKYYYYALEGIEKGSIIENVSYRKSKPNYYGSLTYMQEEDVNKYRQTFELIAPEHLLFDFKSMNGLSEVKYDSTFTEGNRWYIEVDSVTKILDQPIFYPDVVKQGVVYKIDRNTSQYRGGITSYAKIVDNIYTSLHPELDKKQQKNISKLSKEIELSKFRTKKEKIRAIENYVKANFQVIDQSMSQLQDVSFILSNKTANERGILMLQLLLYDLADIKYELVITCDRSELRFDKEFEAYLYLDEYLLYFPEIKEFTAPTKKYIRGKFIPDLLSHTYGLFIKNISINGINTAIGKIKFIEALPYNASTDIMKIDVDFAKNPKMPEININKKSTGYSAQYFQPYIHLMDDEEVENIKKTLTKSIDEQLKPDEVTITNIEVNDFGNKPFILSIKSSEHAFVETAGNDLLFKVGQLIGPQAEMYQEKERQFDVESGHNRYYERTIHFNVPEGYTLKNPEVMNYVYKYGKEGNEDMLFESKIQKGEKGYTIESIEYYATIIVEKERFEEYKTIINAAADFNKKVLVFERK